MLQLASVYKSQSRYGVGSVIKTSESTSYEVYLLNCRNVISDKTPAEYYSWDKRKQGNFTESLITNYVRENPKEVEGFVDENGLEVDRVIRRLITDIADYGILKDALEDDDVQEIQINDFKTIYVVKGGKARLYVDSRGNPYQFVSNEELKATVDRMIYSENGKVPRMTLTDPLLNARTANKGYRLSAVDDSAITRDMTAGFDFPVTSVVIRKYSSSRLTFEDFEKFGSIHPKMSSLLRLSGRANTKLICVGPTSSGKTTLLQAIVWELPEDLRVIFIQNPTELMLYDRDPATGANRRNALHWEAQEVGDKQKDSSTAPTMSNFIAHILRNSPDIGIPGEIRAPSEFYQANRIVNTGHIVMTTFHAENSQDAGIRWANELSTIGGSVMEHLKSFANNIDLIVAQKKLADGSRKVMEISEYTGVIDQDTGLPVVSVLFQFTVTGESKVDPNNKKRILEVGGYFEQVNPISSRLKKKFFMAGINKEELEDFLNVPPTIEGKTNIPWKEAV